MSHKGKKTLPDDTISFEQEVEKRAEWTTEACAANQPISPFSVHSLLHHQYIHGPFKQVPSERLLTGNECAAE